MNSEKPPGLDTNADGKEFEYEKDGVFYGGEYLDELPKEINIEEPTETTSKPTAEETAAEIASIDGQIENEESGLKEAREKLGLNPEEGESSIAVQALKEERQNLSPSEGADSETAYLLQKAKEYLSRGEETAEKAAERLSLDGREHEAEIMLMAGREEKLKQIDAIAEELKTIIEKQASDSGFAPLKETMDGIESVLNSQETTEDFTDLEGYFGSSVDTASIKKSVFQMAYVGNEKGAVRLLAFAKKKLQG